MEQAGDLEDPISPPDKVGSVGEAGVPVRPEEFDVRSELSCHDR
jgi:hypothetical protein